MVGPRPAVYTTKRTTWSYASVTLDIIMAYYVSITQCQQNLLSKTCLATSNCPWWGFKVCIESKNMNVTIETDKSCLWNGRYSTLPADSSPGLPQPVNCVRLKGRQDRLERGEVLQPTTILQRKQLAFRGFTSNPIIIVLLLCVYHHSPSIKDSDWPGLHRSTSLWCEPCERV